MARHSIPAELVSDNGPQFSAETFTNFTKEYGITHNTTSPRHPQGNGKAKQAVKTIKSILNKSDDPYLGLLAYCTTAQWLQPIAITHAKTSLNSATTTNAFLSTTTYSNRPQGQRPKVKAITKRKL